MKFDIGDILKHIEKNPYLAECDKNLSVLHELCITLLMPAGSHHKISLFELKDIRLLG
jgi:hypothetical protein